MKSRKFGFLGHYRKIRLEGINISRVINKCIKNGIPLKNLRWHDPVESTMEIRGGDYDELKKLAGHSYRMTTVAEGGIVPAVRSMKANVVTIIGAFLLGALIFYQSLFIAEIRVDGCRSLDENELRTTMEAAGLYEGARKSGNYGEAKALLYEKHPQLTWVSIFEDGRLIKVKVAEAGREDESEKTDGAPVNIVAAEAGLIEEIQPLQGNAKVQRGDYVNKGDVLISGRYKYLSTDYSMGDGEFIMYSHAKGKAVARIPKQETYYFEKNVREKKPTGNSFVGITLRFGDVKMETTGDWGGYEASVREEHMLIDTVKPLPIAFGLVTVKEVELIEKPQSMARIEKVVQAALRQNEKDELGGDGRILNHSVEYSESSGTIRASVLMETLADIGVEKPITVNEKKINDKAKR